VTTPGFLASTAAAEPAATRRDVRRRILRATLEELAARGYEGTSVEDIADRAGVNKTTVYRRFPTKLELVREAMAQFMEEARIEIDCTGSLRGDLISLGKAMVRALSTVADQGLFRMAMLDRVEPELEQLFHEHQARQRHNWLKIAERAVTRGEVAQTPHVLAAADALAGALYMRILLHKQHVDERDVVDLVDLLLTGVALRGSEPKSRAVPRVIGSRGRVAS